MVSVPGGSQIPACPLRTDKMVPSSIGLLPLGFLGGGPGYGEVILVFLAVLVLFGPKRLPEIARMLGKTLQDLRRASQDFRDQVMSIEPEPEPSFESDQPAIDVECDHVEGEEYEQLEDMTENPTSEGEGPAAESGEYEREASDKKGRGNELAG